MSYIIFATSSTANNLSLIETNPSLETHIWVSKEGLVSINDRLFAVEDVAKIMYDKRVSDPQVIVSLKADEEAKMELISAIHEELREADALKLNYSTKTLVR